MEVIADIGLTIFLALFVGLTYEMVRKNVIPKLTNMEREISEIKAELRKMNE